MSHTVSAVRFPISVAAGYLLLCVAGLGMGVYTAALRSVPPFWVYLAIQIGLVAGGISLWEAVTRRRIIAAALLTLTLVSLILFGLAYFPLSAAKCAEWAAAEHQM